MDAKNRWYVKWIVKSWDMPRSKVITLLDRMGLELHEDETDQYVNKDELRAWLWASTN